MIKKFSILLGLMFFPISAFADCIETCVAAAGCSAPVSNEIFTCSDVRFKCQGECGEKPVKIEHQDDDVLFTGTKLQSGNTTIMQGDRIPVDPSALGHLRAEDLAYFEKSVVYSRNGRGSVSSSESKSQSGLLSESYGKTNQDTTVTSNLSVSSRKHE